MHTKFRVGSDVYVADKATGAVYRRRIVGLTVTTEEEGAGGPYGLFRREACDVTYRLEGQAFIEREEALFGNADEAFASMMILQPAT